MATTSEGKVSVALVEEEEQVSDDTTTTTTTTTREGGPSKDEELLLQQQPPVTSDGIEMTEGAVALKAKDGLTETDENDDMLRRRSEADYRKKLRGDTIEEMVDQYRTEKLRPYIKVMKDHGITDALTLALHGNGGIPKFDFEEMKEYRQLQAYAQMEILKENILPKLHIKF